MPLSRRDFVKALSALGAGAAALVGLSERPEEPPKEVKRVPMDGKIYLFSGTFLEF